MDNEKLQLVNNFAMKVRLYPNKEQQEKIDNILHGVRVIYNTTLYEIVHENEMVTSISKKDPTVRFPNFSACSNKKWRDYIRSGNTATNCVPSPNWSHQVRGLFVDMKKSWEKSGKLPCNKWKPEYYSNKRPRRSFYVVNWLSGLTFSDSSKTIKINITGVGKVKARGWRFDIKFGEECLSREEYFSIYKTKKQFGIIVSKDNCGDYYASIMCQTVWIPYKERENKKPLGIDVGVKEIAITSDGQKYENKHFRKNEQARIEALQQQLSRMEGWANEDFRERYKKDKTLKPSHNYEKKKKRRAKIEKRVAQRRSTYNHYVTTDIVKNADFIGIESLDVKGMMSNSHIANALADAAMSDVLTKIKYKAERYGIPVVEIGQYEPSSQLCSNCGYQNPLVKDLSVREWDCPQCGVHHDRDINAAKNILNIAKAKGLS